ncbi:MAG: HEAT repeat domain-containing protein [Sedimentisphaerales bacterium]|nr:HEAT repeat domain-containing protein [Sedimentisphaerales bacterium]
MRTRIILITAGFILVSFIFSGTASARSSFYIGFGTSAGHCHSSFGHSLFPHYGWHGGYYDWLDRDRYIWMDRVRYYGSLGRWHSCSSGTSIYIGGYWPLYAAPQVVRTRRVVTVSCAVAEPEPPEYKPAYDPANAKRFAEVRNKKSELLKVLKIGDKAAKIKAISELAGYSFDDNVRKALEEVILTDPDAELRRQVAESLAKVKNVNLIPILEKVRVQDTDVQVREQADKAIKSIKAY